MGVLGLAFHITIYHASPLSESRRRCHSSAPTKGQEHCCILPPHITDGLRLLVGSLFAHHTYLHSFSRPRHNGVKIVPSGLRPWLRARGLFFECFCAFSSAPDDPRPCQIVESSLSGNFLAFCHFGHAKCRFKSKSLCSLLSFLSIDPNAVNLSEVYKTTTHIESFFHLPTLSQFF